MKKKIIVLAIALTLGIPALSFADTENVIVYGRANLSFDKVDSGGGAGIVTSQVSSNTSFIGFKGSEELDDGWTATWQVEQQINIDNSSNSTTPVTTCTGVDPDITCTTSTVAANNGILATRNTFVNLLNGQYGVFILGRHDTPYKLVSRTMDVFFDTIADNRSLMGGASLNLNNLSGTSAAASFDGRQGDVLAYIAPAIGDLMITGAYVTGAESANTAGQVKGDAWSFAGLYTAGSLNANLGYEVHNLGSVGTGTLGTPGALAGLADHSERAIKLAVSYAIESATLYGVYERIKDDFGTVLSPATGADFFGHKSYYLAGKYVFGNNAVKAAYTRSGELRYSHKTGAKQWSLGYDRKLSRRTSLYALYTRLDNDSAATYNLAPPDGPTGNATASAAGAILSALSVGVRHSF